MTKKTIPFTTDSVPLRAPRRWFKCIEYAGGLKIELPQPDEAAAIAAGIEHLDAGHGGTVKIGYYGFRSRVILYKADELLALRAH